jgi:hypothetical protein
MDRSSRVTVGFLFRPYHVHLCPGHQPAAHTDGGSIVYFRRSEVISAGDIYPTTGCRDNGSQRSAVPEPPFVTSSNFKKLPDAGGWNPAPCPAK